jgi:D-tyrosyl-tRNA(Tyr) deacylase
VGNPIQHDRGEAMRALLQRVNHAKVTVDDQTVGEIGSGLAVLLGVKEGDTPEDAAKLADKTANLRIFSDADGKFNLSLLDVGGAVLVVSQFTLYGDSRKGRRPSFTDAALPGLAEPLVARYCSSLRSLGIRVEEGQFQAHMLVEIHNDGPVTLILDTEDLARPRRQ